PSGRSPTFPFSVESPPPHTCGMLHPSTEVITRCLGIETAFVPTEVVPIYALVSGTTVVLDRFKHLGIEYYFCFIPVEGKLVAPLKSKDDACPPAFDAIPKLLANATVVPRNDPRMIPDTWAVQIVDVQPDRFGVRIRRVDSNDLPDFGPTINF